MTKFKVKVNATSTCKNVAEYDIEVSSSRQSIEFNEKTLANHLHHKKEQRL